jgi:hypothetical protein
MVSGLWCAILCAISLASPAMAAPPAAVDDVVLFARDSMEIGYFVRHSSGQLVVNAPGGIMLFARSAEGLSGTQVVADTIAVRGGRSAGPTLSEVYANSVAPSVVVTASGPDAVTLPLLPFPSASVVTPGTDMCPRPGRKPGDCVIGRDDGPVTVLPGNYGTIRVKARATLHFAGGTYNARAIRAGANARVLFDGTTTLNVAERAVFGRRVVFGPTNVGVLNPRCVVVNVAGEKPVRFGGLADVGATIVVPNAGMRLGGFGVYQGNFIATAVQALRYALLEAAPPLMGPCP